MAAEFAYKREMPRQPLHHHRQQQPLMKRVQKRRDAARNKYNEVVSVEKTPSHQLFNSTIERLDPDLYDGRNRQLRADVLAEEAQKLDALQPDNNGDAVNPRSFLRLGPPEDMGAGSVKAARMTRPHPGLCSGCQQVVKALKLARQKYEDQRAAQQLRISQARQAVAEEERQLQVALDRLQSLRAETKVKEREVAGAMNEAAAQLEVESHLILAARDEHEHEKQRASGFEQPDDGDSSPTDWNGGGGILAAASAMLAKAPQSFKTASPKSSPRPRDLAEGISAMEARDLELENRRKALRVRQLELERLRNQRDVRLREPGSPRSPRSVRSYGDHYSGSPGSPRSVASFHSGATSPHSLANEEDQEAADADAEMERLYRALASLVAAWDDWLTWRRAKVRAAVGKRAGTGSEPRALRLLLQREGAQLSECTLVLPREHSRSVALKAEVEAVEAEKITRKTKRATAIREGALARRKHTRVEARNKGVKGTKSTQLKPIVVFKSQPEPEPEAEIDPLEISSPADVERLMQKGKHGDAMKAMQSYLRGRGGSLDMARAVTRAATGIGDDDGGTDEGGKAGSRRWNNKAPTDWREVRREETRRMNLNRSTRGGIQWKKLVNTKGGDVPYTAAASVNYGGVAKQVRDAAAGAAAGGVVEEVAATGLNMTQELSDAMDGLPPGVLEHLSAVW